MEVFEYKAYLTDEFGRNAILSKYEVNKIKHKLAACRKFLAY